MSGWRPTLGSLVLLLAPACPLQAGAGLAGGWNGDFRSAMEDARSTGRDHLIVFTGLAWEPWSRKLRDEALANPAFVRALAKDFVLTHIDLPERPGAPGALGEREVRHYELAARLHLHVFPSLYLCTPDGRPYGLVGHLEGDALLAAIRARRQAWNALQGNLRRLAGSDRAVAIDAWLQTLPEPLRALHRDKMEMIVAADPRNQTGLWSTYKLALLLPKARELRYAGRLDEAEPLYREVIDTVKPTGTVLQDTCYELADIHFQRKDYDQLLDTLERAIAAAPDSPRMSVLREMMDVFTRQWIYAKWSPDRMSAVGYDIQKIVLAPADRRELSHLTTEALQARPDSARSKVLEAMRNELAATEQARR